jgi:hypothetical protein
VLGAEGLLPDGEGFFGKRNRLRIAALIIKLHGLPVERIRLAEISLLGEAIVGENEEDRQTRHDDPTCLRHAVAMEPQAGGIHFDASFWVV